MGLLLGGIQLVEFAASTVGAAAVGTQATGALVAAAVVAVGSPQETSEEVARQKSVMGATS